jgi:hypothetical protein
MEFRRVRHVSRVRLRFSAERRSSF